MSRITVAICVYNGADRLAGLVDALRQQACPIPFEIVIIDNNSTDKTREIALSLSHQSGVPLRLVRESRQGIPFARNRAIEEALATEYLGFVDIDELPGPTWLGAAVDALSREGAECVGGAIRVRLPSGEPPRWLHDELLGFLGRVDYGEDAFWVDSPDTPVWSGNVAYRTRVFANGLRFDTRYNRVRNEVGGGEDHALFRRILQEKIKIRYRPDMLIEHFIDRRRLTRRYFLRLHFAAGQKFGEYELCPVGRQLMGVPPYLIHQTVRQLLKTLRMLMKRDPGGLRQAMNTTHALGSIHGRLRHWASEKGIRLC
jgi:glycosyltransferase involved in cell wall biosynthesis